MSHAELFAPLGVGLQFDVTLPCCPPLDELAACDDAADHQEAAAAAEETGDADAQKASAAEIDAALASLPAPVLSFSISASSSGAPSSISGALALAAAELLLGPEERRTIQQAAQAVLEATNLEQLQRKYTQVLLRELQQQPHHTASSSSSGSSLDDAIAQQLKPRRQDSSDSIGHWETEEEDESQSEQKQDGAPAAAAVAAAATPQQQPARAPAGALAAWKRARFTSTGSSTAATAVAASASTSASRRRTSSDPRLVASSSVAATAAAPQPPLSALLSTLLAAAAVPLSAAATGSSSAVAPSSSSSSSRYLLTPDSPLSKLYQLSSLYHTEHLVYLAKKQASYTALGAEQSREMDIICQQAQQSEIEGAAMHGMETAAPEHASAASALSPPASTMLSRSSSSSSNASSASSATALSEAISLLVQSHLSQSAYLEDLWESRLDAWCAAQRRKFRVYARDTLEEFVDRAGREGEAQRQHRQVQARLALQADRKKGAKILMSEQEELEEAEREAARERAARGPHPLEIMQRVFSAADARGAAEMEALLASKLDSRMINPAWQPQPAVVDEKAVAAARALALSAAARESASSSMPSPLSIASAPPAPVPPFPLACILAAKAVYLGPPSRAPERPLQLFLTNDPLFVPNNQRGAATAAAAAAAAGSSATAAASAAAAAASLPVSSSPLISLPHFVSALDALYGPRGAGGLAAMVLPHHSSPLSHAAYAMPPTATEGDDAGAAAESAAAEDADASVDLDAININSLPTSLPSDSASRRAREKALNAFSAANLYTKNLLQYCRAQNDLMCEDLAMQMARLERELVRRKTLEVAASATTKAKGAKMLPPAQGALDDDLILGDRDSVAAQPGPLVLSAAPAAAAVAAVPSIDSLLSHGDTLLTRHSHLLNAQLCFHVNVLPRRGGVAGAVIGIGAGGAHGMDSPGAAGNGSSVSGVVMNEAELKQQSTLFSVLSHIVSLSCSHNIRALSLPLIWDNILLSMWSTSGNYVGFGWKDADNAYAAAAAAANAAAAEAAGTGDGGVSGSSLLSNSSGGGVGGGLSSLLLSVESNRQEELEVYQCMVRYLESVCRTIKQVLGALPPDAPLRSIVFYLPAQINSGGGGGGGGAGGAGGGAGAGHQGHALDLDASGTHGAVLLGGGGDGSEDAGAHSSMHASSSSSSAGAHAQSGGGGANQHPFLAKCKAIFAEVFQSS